MTDHDIRDYIESCEEPIILKDVMSKLTSKDPTISWKRVTKLMREMGFENKVCKNALNDKGKGSVWTRVNAVATDDEVDEVDDDEVDDDEVDDDEDDNDEDDDDEDDDDEDDDDEDDDDEDDDDDDDDDEEVEEVEDDEDCDEDDEDSVSDAEKTEGTKDTKARTRSTAEALRDVSAKNDEDSDLLQRLFIGLTRSRSLKEELMKRQQEMLLELARRILGLYGSEKERKTYGDF